MSLGQKIKRITKKFIKSDFKNRQHMIHLVTMMLNFVVAAGKILMAIYLSSIFLFVSSLYTLMVGFSKQMYFRAIDRSYGQLDKEKKYAYRINAMLLASAFFYIIYMARLFYMSAQFEFSGFIGIAIALIAFIELGVAIYGLIRSSKSRDILFISLKTVNLSSALVAIGLTNYVILSYVNQDEITGLTNEFSSAIIGLVIGCINGFLALSLIYKTRKRTSNEIDLDITT
jgi:hypothetical protein